MNAICILLWLLESPSHQVPESKIFQRWVGLEIGSLEQSSWVATTPALSRAPTLFSGVLPGNKLGFWDG